MTTKYIRDILPIDELERQDRKGGKYPVAIRIGDKFRRGDNGVFFDDTQTLIYSTNSNVSFPTTLPISSSYIADDLKSTISVVGGTVTKGGTDQFINVLPQTEAYTPYNENKNIDVSVSDSFQSGSEISVVGLGFNARLRDKTMIKIELPVASTTQLVASGGYYYNFSTQTFEPLALSFLQGSAAASSIFGAANVPPLFSCFGTQLSRNYQITSKLTSDKVNSIWSYDSSFSLLQSSSYAATGTIPGSTFIPKRKSFIVEKATMEFGFSANASWLNDSTQQYITNDVANPPIVAVGGPAITFGILNQVGPGRRDLIMSGTVIPASDTTPWVSNLYNGSGSGIGIYRGLGGFTNWATPNVVVPGTTTFTGSLKMQMTANSANGVVLTNTNNAPGMGLSTIIAAVNPFGRSMSEASGRSIFGKEFVKPQNIQAATGSALYSLPFDQFDSLNQTSVSQTRIISLDQNSPSPYLLRENDNIVLYVMTPKAALTASSVGSSPPVTASYGVSINSGTIFLTLYGSEISENVEFHDTLNQRLETNQVHEAIDFSPVLDQFDVAFSQEFSGSSLGAISVSKAVQYLGMGILATSNASNQVNGLSIGKITGSLETDQIFDNFSTAADSTSWSSQLGWSTWKQIREIKKSHRNLNLISDNELIADTRIPNPFQALRVCNPSVLVNDRLTYPFPVTILYAGMTGALGGANGAPVKGGGMGDWLMSYPFESKYSSVPSTFSNLLRSERWFISGGPIGTTSLEVNYDQLMIEVGSGTLYSVPGISYNPRFVFSEGTAAITAGAPDTMRNTGLGIPEFTKIFFGFGDGISPDCNQYCLPRNTGSVNGVGTAFGVCAEIRGWRHGLASGFPMYSSAVFRRTSYGQFRDMLEQRQDTKFFDSLIRSLGNSRSLLPGPVTVKFVDSTGRSTRPEYTYSSNLSVEATSSYPYSDGIVKNREEPITLARPNQSFVII